MTDPAQSSHPDGAHLAAFARGGLAAAERAVIEGHLVECLDCREALMALPAGDSAEVQETLPPSGKVLVVPPAPTPRVPVPARAGPVVPADLVNHPRYEVLQLLGRGGMGSVYKARHKIMNRLVALKVINPQLVDNEHAVERFHREVQAAAKLHHPNIVTAHDADRAGATHFLVTEFVEGTDLAAYVTTKGPLPPALACHVARQAALGLQHAHERGTVHRDIKPHNLMLTPGGVVKVMDFGLARLVREGGGSGGLTGENVLMGSADYIAPEQARDAHKADIRADLYSLGCTLYHLLTGEPPFGGDGVVAKVAAHLMEPPPLDRLPPVVPRELRAVLARLLEKDPAKRYQTPAELAQALLPHVKKPPSTARMATAARKLPQQPGSSARHAALRETDRTAEPPPAGAPPAGPPGAPGARPGDDPIPLVEDHGASPRIRLDQDLIPLIDDVDTEARRPPGADKPPEQRPRRDSAIRAQRAAPRSVRREGWRDFRRGINLLVLAFWAYLFATLWGLAVLALGSTSHAPGPLLYAPCGLGMLAGVFAQTVGHFFAMMVPTGVGATARNRSAAAFYVLCALLLFCGLSLASGVPRLIIFAALSYCVVCTYWLRSLSADLNDRKLVNAFSTYLVLLAFLPCGAIVTHFIGRLLEQDGMLPVPGGILGMPLIDSGEILVGLLLWLRLLVLLQRLRDRLELPAAR